MRAHAVCDRNKDANLNEIQSKTWINIGVN